MGYWGMTSFLWDFFKWFFQGDPASSNCGFNQFPSLGLSALAQSWSFDFQLNYIGVGESISPYGLFLTLFPPFLPLFLPVLPSPQAVAIVVMPSAPLLLQSVHHAVAILCSRGGCSGPDLRACGRAFKAAKHML